MKKMSKRNLWLAAIILSYLYILISKKMINTYKENEILVLNYSASMICDFALLGMFIIRKTKMKKRYNIFKNSFSKKSAFEKNLKNDEKVEKFGKAIRTAGNQLIELGENWLEEDEMNAYQLKKVEEMVKQTKKMLAKL